MLQLWATTEGDLDQAVEDMRQLVDANANIADCSLEQVAGPEGAAFTADNAAATAAAASTDADEGVGAATIVTSSNDHKLV